MTDSLHRLCGLRDLAPEERQRLLSVLDYISDVLSSIERGAGFCEDRGFPWTLDMERDAGADGVLTPLREWPILRRLLPSLRHLCNSADPLIARVSQPSDEVIVAQLLLTNTRSFSEHCGEGVGAGLLTLRLDSDVIRVHEETFATALNGQPFHESDQTAEYSADPFGNFWSGLREKLPTDVWRQASTLAGRMNSIDLPCDTCGWKFQTLSLSGQILTCARPLMQPTSKAVSGADVSILREAFAGHDIPVIRRLAPEWTEGYCAACDAIYCPRHLQFPDKIAADVSGHRLRCPVGHEWEIDSGRAEIS